MRDRGALIALALVLAAIVIVAFFIPEVAKNQLADNPTQAAGSEQDYQEAEWFGDTPAQWLMAIFAGLATLVSWRALVWLRNTFEQTKLTADAALAANETNREIGEAQTRAYVTAVRCSMRNLVVGEKPFARVTFANSGNTPATNITVRGSITLGAYPPERDHPQLLTSDPMHTTGLPGNSGAAETDVKRFKVFTSEEYIAIEEGSMAFYIYVVIDFIDVFGRFNCSRSMFVQAAETGQYANRAPYGNSFEWGLNQPHPRAERFHSEHAADHPAPLADV